MNFYLHVRILFDAIIATSLMTMFSYIFSILRKKQFKEPELLNDLLRRINLIKGPNIKKHATGWIIHYTVGWIFVTVYYLLFKNFQINPTLWVYTALGFICGIVGIAGWKVTFAIHPNPPDIHFSEFYLHLLAAHIVFGIGAFMAYKLGLMV
jgi:hypothetical protein